mmetsp:Transcript_28947/g.58735  ORF Transcript_28947/g.58735 Transcript_28947/m.58735 type:complete len:116 (-) Transcript_28947:120-467(-)
MQHLFSVRCPPLSACPLLLNERSDDRILHRLLENGSSLRPFIYFINPPTTMRLAALLLATVATTSAFAPSNVTPRARSTTALDATIAVIGASGLTASECVYQALKEGDTVVGLTR